MHSRVKISLARSSKSIARQNSRRATSKPWQIESSKYSASRFVCPTMTSDCGPGWPPMFFSECEMRRTNHDDHEGHEALVIISLRDLRVLRGELQWNQ